LSAEIASHRLGEEQLQRENRAEEDQHEHAVRDIEERARHALRARRDQPLEPKAQHHHQQQDLKGEAPIESVDKFAKAGQPVVRIGAVRIGAGPGNTDGERNHQQERNDGRDQADRQAQTPRSLVRGFE
jgi:hypothetical protein